MKVAAEGDHYRLAFDKPGTWSQKYNLVWDRILGLNVFPPSVAQKEVAHYKKVMLRYGVPLDTRTHLTKTDWSIWCATLAENRSRLRGHHRADLRLSERDHRPRSDRRLVHRPTTSPAAACTRGRSWAGSSSRCSTDRDVWRKWASRDTLKPANWAPLPPPPKISMLVPTEQTWHYTTAKPGDQLDEARLRRDAAGRKAGPASAPARRGFIQHTLWKTDDIWLRREITVPEGEHPQLQFIAYHDEDVEIYVNGILAAQEGGFTTSYVPLEISREARALMKPGAKILVAVHCHQTKGGQGIDVGLGDVTQ